MSTLETFTRGLGSLLGAGDIDLPSLDLDELAALLPADAPSMPPVATLGDPTAIVRGRKRLQERGLIDSDGALDSDLELLMTLRRFPGSILIVEAGASEPPTMRCYLGFTDVGFLEEILVADDCHSFAIRSARSALSRLVDLCNPMNVAGLDGPLVAAPVGSDDEPWCSLGRADSAARLNVTRWTGDEGTAQVGLTIVVIGDRIWSLSDVWASEAFALPLSRAGLQELLSRLVYNESTARC